MHLLVTGGEAAVMRPGFAGLCRRILVRGVRGLSDCDASPCVLLNEHLEPIVAAGDLEGTRLARACMACRMLTASGKSRVF